jgi:hypothetical protein
MVLLWPSNYANFQLRILVRFVKINQVAFEEHELNMDKFRVFLL